MGFTPREIGAMTFAEYVACYDGWKSANSSGDEAPEAPSVEQFQEWQAAIAAKQIAVH